MSERVTWIFREELRDATVVVQGADVGICGMSTTTATKGNRIVVLLALQNQVTQTKAVQPSGTVCLRGAPKN